MKVYMYVVGLIAFALCAVIGYNIGQTAYHNYTKSKYYALCMEETAELPVPAARKEWMCYQAIYVGK